MRISLAQVNYIIGNFDYNIRKIAEAIEKAKSENADLVVFSELAICGYPPLDLLEHKWFVEKCIEGIEKVAQLCHGIAAIVGGVSINPNPQGKILYNTGFFLNNGKIESMHHKALLPTYDIFDEYRYFEPGTCFQVIEYKQKKIALTICEDLWDNPPVEYPFGRTQLYNVSPMENLAAQKPDCIINIAASPFSYTKGKVKQEIFSSHAAKHKIPLFYVNQTGAHTDLIFDGGSMIIDPNGKIAYTLAYFNEDFTTVELDNIIQKPFPAKEISEIESIHDALVLGIKDYFAKTGLKTAVLGLSGGIDSAVVLALAVKALGNDKVRVLLMPSKYSSDHSVNDAREMAEILKIQYDLIGIQEPVDSVLQQLKPVFKNLPEDLTEENIQARMRGMYLMAISNKFGNMLLNTSNKSEMAVGYGTLYGDMNGGISVLGDVYKTDVYRLAHFINQNGIIIPKNIIEKAPSAELRPGQKDSDSLPDYALLDAILFRYVEQLKGAEEIVSQGFDRVIVEKTIRMVNFNEYKRFQTPPVLRISTKAFGIGRKMPIVGRY